MTWFPERVHRALLAFVTLLALSMSMPMSTSAAPPEPSSDPYLWLEDVLGDKALGWVRERNAESRAVLEAHPDFQINRARLLSILDSTERIPTAERSGSHFYNFWRDKEHPRGVWRRTSLSDYQSPTPAWELLLDLDALAKTENENWVWHGVNCLGGSSTRCLVSLSRGGSDAVVVREFDRETRKFLASGFVLPEAKSSVDWLDENTLIVGTDFGLGTQTDSGYPRVLKWWKRGSPLAQASLLYEGKATDVAVAAEVDRSSAVPRVVVVRAENFFTTESFLWQDDRLIALPKPIDAKLKFWGSRVLLELRSDWVQGSQRWPRGALLVADAAAFVRGDARFEVLFTPTATRSLAGFATTRTQVLLNVLDNVASRGEVLIQRDGKWTQHDLAAPYPGTLRIQSLHDPQVKNDSLAESYFLYYTDFLTPDSLYLGQTDQGSLFKLKTRPAFFDASGMHVEQRHASSKDGTRIPYFVVWPKGSNASGKNPTLLYGYGGFEISMNPWYSASFGTAWLNKGGVLVVANIRGGGEFGPGWHQAALKANKQKSYDDFIAVAQDLIASKITDARHLGIEGGSNGGLLVGAVMTQRPELFGAVVCQVPLLDMRRYHLLLAGASWMSEYGNPDDPTEWAYISKYSPYQNVKPGVKYPKTLLITSTRDDRVHPGHARKMAALMRSLGQDVLYHEYIEGGHAAASDNAQRADRQALEFAFLWQQLGS